MDRTVQRASSEGTDEPPNPTMTDVIQKESGGRQQSSLAILLFYKGVGFFFYDPYQVMKPQMYVLAFAPPAN